MEIRKTFSFDAAHRLPRLPDGHKCARMHGHTFTVEVRLAGPVDPRMGWVVDFADVARAVEPVLETLDHACLNDVEGLENPTSENLAVWIWRRLEPALPLLSQVAVQEDPTSAAIYRGEPAG